MKTLKLLIFVVMIGIVPDKIFAWQGMSTPSLHIEGRYLKDPSGKTVILHGWMQPTSSYFNGRFYSDPTTFTPENCAEALNVYKSIVNLLSNTSPLFGYNHGWYNNFVRIWTPSDGWNGDGTVDEALQDRAWNNMYIPYVEHCRSRGIYVVFVGNCPDGGTFMSAQHKSNMIKFWTRICNRYPAIKNADNVMFEICNEPVNIESQLGNGDWGSVTDAHDRAVQAYFQDIVNAIRGTGANNIVWVPGLIWQDRLLNFATYPISGNNIGYAGHMYPFGGDNPTDINNRFISSGWKACSDKYPIIVTEGSWHTMDADQGIRRGTTQGFGITAKNFYDTQGNINWICGMTEELIGNMEGGISAFTYPEINCGRAGFDWWPTYTWAAPGSGCTPTAITPYIQVNGGTWQQTSSVTVASGATVKFGPQPASGGSWRWSGCGTSGTSREQTVNPTSTCTATATYTNTGGCQSTQNLTVTVSGSSSSSSSSSGIVSGGVYRITPRNGGKALDVNGCGTADGTNVQNWSWQNNNCQKWQFTSLTGGYWRLSPMNATSKALDVSGVSTADGANVNIWAYGGGNNQQWQMVDLGSGYYHIKARHSGKCLDLNGGSTVDGANIQQWTCSTSNTNQHFSLTRISSSKDGLTESLTGYTLYPSPVDDNLHITFNGQEKVNVRIYNNLGALALSYDFTGDTKTLDVSKLTSGMYFIRLEGNERTITDRFIKK